MNTTQKLKLTWNILRSEADWHRILTTVAMLAVVLGGLAAVTIAAAQTTTTVTVEEYTVQVPGPCHVVTGLPGTTHALSIVETEESVAGTESPAGRWSKPGQEPLCEQIGKPAAPSGG